MAYQLVVFRLSLKRELAEYLQIYPLVVNQSLILDISLEGEVGVLQSR